MSLSNYNVATPKEDYGTKRVLNLDSVVNEHNEFVI
jgi:hypothetical protein